MQEELDVLMKFNLIERNYLPSIHSFLHQKDTTQLLYNFAETPYSTIGSFATQRIGQNSTSAQKLNFVLCLNHRRSCECTSSLYGFDPGEVSDT
jgi:hypothetical protein